MKSTYVIPLTETNTQELISLCKSGFSIETFNGLTEYLQVTGTRLASIVNIKKSTLLRRKQNGRFTFEESERLCRIARLCGLAATVLGSPENARDWLNTPSGDFEGRTPLEYAETELGAHEVEAILGRIADGVLF